MIHLLMKRNLTSSHSGKIPLPLPCLALATVLLLLASVVLLPCLGQAGSQFLPFRFLTISTFSKQSTPMVKPLKGRFLIASRQLLDPHFAKTVVLLLEYHKQGAMGLIINRPSDMKLSAVLPEVEELQQRPDTIYLGGPVARTQLLLLIRTSSPPEGSRHILHDIHLSSSQAVIQRMINDPEAEERFRVYAGYAGWAPGQLDKEIASGGWHVLRADAETVFDKSAPEIWPELIHRSSAQWVWRLEQ
jgi:putative transcriptional regulator